MTKYFCDKCGRELSSLAGGRYQATIHCHKLLGSDNYTADFCADCIKEIVGPEVIEAHEAKEAERKAKREQRKKEREKYAAAADTFAPSEDLWEDSEE